ncbi:helix-turn-helix transcriptional regulator [Streptomyces sp. NPDC059816]|uniref:helix-turn-helix transcriptional regulator n=1 Tax=Streptomyces sp. NPDC059816 TaxID=3346960 RepID=UPI00364CBBFF
MAVGAPVPFPEHGSEPLSPGQLLGHPGLLRAWRAVAGEKLGLGRPLSQTEVAEAIGRSRGWYQNLERGARPKMEREVLDALTKTLRLGPDEYQALVLALMDGALTTIPTSLGNPTVRRDLQQLLDHQLPNPAYLTDQVWNIIGYNTAMAALWPWVREPRANLIRWAMLSPEARVQYVNWDHHATEYTKLLRFASTRYPHDPGLSKLITEVKADPRCGQLWDTDVAAVSQSRDGHLFQMSLPSLDNQPLDVISHVLFPASLPGSRATVITWAGTDEDDTPVSSPRRTTTPWSYLPPAVTAYTARQSMMAEMRADLPSSTVGPSASATPVSRACAAGSRLSPRCATSWPIRMARRTQERQPDASAP